MGERRAVVCGQPVRNDGLFLGPGRFHGVSIARVGTPEVIMVRTVLDDDSWHGSRDVLRTQRKESVSGLTVTSTINNNKTTDHEPT